MASYDYLTETGLIVPNTSTTKADVQQEYISVFGADLNLDDATPQGRLIDVETVARDGVVRLVAETTNMINPDVSAGVFLESICSLHAIVAAKETFSYANGLIFTGTPGTIINSGSRVGTATGDQFQILNALTIGAGGTITGDVQAVVGGPIVAPAGSITQIVDGTLGWTAVTNPTDAIVGTSAETELALRQRRKRMLSYLSRGTNASIQANVRAVQNVRDVVSRENPSATTTIIDSVTLTPHSTWVCVLGGVDSDIGSALVASKQSGSPYTAGVSNGIPVTVVVIDPWSGQNYDVTFVRAEEIPMAVKVTVSAGTSTANLQLATIDSIIRYATGQMPQDEGLVLGIDVSPYELSAAINYDNPGFFVRNVEVGSVASGPTLSTSVYPIELWQLATIATGNIQVVVV